MRKKVALLLAGSLTNLLCVAACGRVESDEASEVNTAPRTADPHSPQTPSDDVQSDGVETIVLDATSSRPAPVEEHVVRAEAFQLVTKEVGRATLTTHVSSFTRKRVRMADGEDYDRIDLPGATELGEEGTPAFPMLSKEYQLQAHGKVRVEILDVTWEDVPGRFNLPPAQADQFDSQPAPAFVKSAAAYAAPGYHGDTPVRVLEIYTVRGRTFATVGVQPFQWESQTGRLRVARDISWQLVPEHGIGPLPAAHEEELSDDDEVGVSEDEDLVPVFDPDVTLNQLIFTPTTGAADYLIITHDDYYDQAIALARWKYAMGLKTVVVRTSSLASSGTLVASADQVRAYVQNAYNNWSPRPAYVLLVGDSDDIPPSHYGDWYDTKGAIDAEDIPTDLYYSTMEGDDYYPDLALGRLPCRNITQCTTAIGKILTWDRSPSTQLNGYWRTMLFAAEFQDDHNGVHDDREDRWFLETTEGIRHYLRLTHPNIDVKTVYINNAFRETANARPIRRRSDSILNSSGLPYSMPDSGDQTSGTSSGGTTRFITTGSNGSSDVINAINAGVQLVLHRDHGGVNGWGLPGFSRSNASALTNGVKTPLVLSIECFAGSLDQDSFAKRLINNPNGGAHAVVASSRMSLSGANDWLAHGYFNCMKGDLYSRLSGESGYRNLSYGGNTWSLKETYGELLNCAKKTMRDKVGTGRSRAERTYELFHLFGDPAGAARSRSPISLTVTASPLRIKYQSSVATSGSTPVNVSVTNSYAGSSTTKVAITEDGASLTYGRTEKPLLVSGVYPAPNPHTLAASMSVPWGASAVAGRVLRAYDHVNLTVTSRDSTPHQSSVPISVYTPSYSDFTALQPSFTSYWNYKNFYATNRGSFCAPSDTVSRKLSYEPTSGASTVAYQCAVACPSGALVLDTASNGEVCTCSQTAACPASQECVGATGTCRSCGEIDDVACTIVGPGCDSIFNPSCEVRPACREGTNIGGYCRRIVVNPPQGCSNGTSYIKANQGLYPNQWIYSCDGRSRLYMQGDGNLVLSQKDASGNFSIALWTSRTNGIAVEVAVMQDDGNLVLYRPDGTAVWSSRTHGKPGLHLKLFNGGNMKLYDGPYGTVWETHTGGH